ncbi:inosine/xanthosine triphosphatase [Halobaculum sp. CBA1158]|uniref:DUF84 family protein n=1 Tax=Halobaculum sp. CBA1158 TaxID=2904243 RepID=UPI001F371FFC|nr:inosine/xanthosine triphosphatase [Halobaculum sp. CBA1158]UIP00828.1 inosine/xanthosine triphosphatase [Halobaculum sp. CBA1158]
MQIGVGSGNPVKRAATERAVTDVEWVGETIDETVVEAHPVPSGVAEQPRGTAETREGAVNRANAVLSSDGAYDLGVGIEGGVAAFDGDGSAAEGGGPAVEGGESAVAGDDTLFLVMWAAVSDGDRLGLGAGPSLALPASIGDRVRDGEELGPVMDDVLGESDVARRQGAAGALTAGGVDRTDALRTAVAGALGPFVTGLYE